MRKRRFPLVLFLILALFIAGFLILGTGRLIQKFTGALGPLESKIVSPIERLKDKGVLLENPMSGYSQLDDREKEVYAKITDSLERYEPTTELSDEKVAVESLIRVWKAVVQDSPGYFWFDSYTYNYDKNTNLVLNMTFNFFYDKDEIKRRQALIDERVDAILAGIDQNWDDYSKVKTVHDAVIRGTAYDLSSPDNQNICSVLINGRSVCAGHTRSMQYILQKMGIFSTYVMGEVTNREAHAWNLVQMDGDYYYVDATLDDPSFSDESMTHPNYVSYANFGITTQELLRDHVIFEELIDYPELTATANNYFVKENLIFNYSLPGEKNRFIDLLKETASQGQPMLQVKFSDASMLSAALGDIELSDLLSHTTIRYIKDDDNKILTLIIGE